MSKMGQYVLERDEILQAASLIGISREDFFAQCEARKKHPYNGASLDWAWEVLNEMKANLDESRNDRSRT